MDVNPCSGKAEPLFSKTFSSMKAVGHAEHGQQAKLAISDVHSILNALTVRSRRPYKQAEVKQRSTRPHCAVKLSLQSLKGRQKSQGWSPTLSNPKVLSFGGS